jgi:hypothetical protein
MFFATPEMTIVIEIIMRLIFAYSAEYRYFHDPRRINFHAVCNVVHEIANSPSFVFARHGHTYLVKGRQIFEFI